jgi:hypothetical protein
VTLQGRAIDAERTSPERDDLKQPAGNRDVLQKMRHRVGVSKVAMKTECRRDRYTAITLATMRL